MYKRLYLMLKKIMWKTLGNYKVWWQQCCLQINPDVTLSWDNDSGNRR